MKLRPILDNDWPRLQDFVSRHFGFSHIPDRRFHEHWFRNPRTGEWTGRLLERSDGSLAGALLVIVAPGWFAGKSTTLAYLSTGVVEDDARDKGQGAALYLWAYRTFPLVLAMSGNALSAPLNALMGCELPGVSLRRSLRLNRPEALDLCRPEDRPKVSAPIEPASALPPGTAADWCDRIPEDYDDLWRAVRGSLVVSLDRTAAYLAWRYSAPYVPYRFLTVRSGPELIGLAVCRDQNTPAGSACRVTDLIAREQDRGTVWRCVAAATKDALFSDFLSVGSTQEAGLADAGFLTPSASNGLAAIPHLLSPVEHRDWTGTFSLGGSLAQSNTAWHEPDRLYFTKGDGDRDWPTLYDLERLGVEAA